MDERAVPTKPAPTFPALSFPDTQAPFRYWVQMALPAVYGDELSYYELLSKVVKVLNDALANMNLLNEDVKELAEFTSRLSQWTQDYFKNLDVQEEINNKLDQMAASGIFDKILEKLFSNTQIVVNVVHYGADKTGVTDSTEAVNAAIAASEKGQTVYFPTGKYKLGQIELKGGREYDFDGSSLSFSDVYGLTVNGTQIGCAPYALTANLAIGSQVLTTTYNGNIPVGTVAVITNPSQQFQHDRQHYKTGYTCIIGKNNQMVPSCPINIDMQGASVMLYEPAKVTIRNISDFEFEDESVYYQHGIVMQNTSDCVVDNVYTEMQNYEGILMENCYGCAVKRFSYNDAKQHTAQQPEAHYPVSTKNSTFCGIDDCTIYSMWHAFSTGGDYLNYRCYAKNSTLFASSQFGFLDHNVAIGSLLENCILSGATIAAGGTIRDCIVGTTGRHGAFTATNGGVYLYGGELPDQSYTIENTIFDYAETPSNNNFGIAGSFEVTDGDATGCRIDNVSITNCKTTGGFPILLSLYRSTGVPVEIGTVSVVNSNVRTIGANSTPANSSLGALIYSNCTLDLSNALSASYLAVNLDVFPNVGSVMMSNCRIIGNTVSTVLVSLSRSGRLIMNSCVIDNFTQIGLRALTAYLDNVIATGDGLLISPQIVEYLMMNGVNGKLDYANMSGCTIGTVNDDAPRESTETSVIFGYVLGSKAGTWEYHPDAATGELVPTKVK